MEIYLPDPYFDLRTSLDRSIYKRESIRQFSDREISPEYISLILWAAQGKKGQKRTVPSAGATYPLEIYAILKNQGLFYYDLVKHSLVLQIEENICEDVANASWNQTFICEAPFTVIICAEFSRTTNRYGERGIRYVYMEVGHCAQNIHLKAVDLGLGSVPIGAYVDREVKNILQLPKSLEPLYIIPIGYPK